MCFMDVRTPDNLTNIPRMSFDFPFSESGLHTYISYLAKNPT